MQCAFYKRISLTLQLSNRTRSSSMQLVSKLVCWLTRLQQTSEARPLIHHHRHHHHNLANINIHHHGEEDEWNDGAGVLFEPTVAGPPVRPQTCNHA